MSSEAPPLVRKCAEVFMVESTNLFLYKCLKCFGWFGTHSECLQHVLEECQAVAEFGKTESENKALDSMEYHKGDEEFIETHLGRFCIYSIFHYL